MNQKMAAANAHNSQANGITMRITRIIISAVKTLLRKLKPQSEDLTYERFINLEGKKFPGQKQEEPPRTMYIRHLDL